MPHTITGAYGCLGSRRLHIVATDVLPRVAALNGQAGVLRALCDCGVSPTEFLPDGFHSHCTALHLAVLQGHWPAATELLHYVCVPACTPSHVYPPSTSALSNLLARRFTQGARLDTVDKLCGASAVEWATQCGDKSIERQVAHAAVFYTAVDAILAGDVEALQDILLSDTVST